MAGYAISLVGSVLSLVLYARILGPSDYGRLAVDLALVEAFQGALFQWHRLAIVRFWAINERHDLASYVVTHHWVWLALAGASIVIPCAIVLVDGASSRAEWSAVWAMGVSKSAALYAQEIARAQGASVRYALGATLITLGGAVAGILAYHAMHSITAVLVAATLVFIASAVLCGLQSHRGRSAGHFDRESCRTMMSYGLPLIPVFIAVTALTRIDRPILAQFEPPPVVGTYAAASGLITNMIAAACLLIVTPAYPWLLREKTLRSEASYRDLHARVGLLMLGCVVAISIAVYGARSLILPLMLGRAIGGPAQAYVLALLAIAVIGAFRAHFFDQAFHLFSRTRTLMGINFATLAVALIAIYSGTRRAGLEGLIVGMLIANTASLLFSAFYARSFINLKQLMRGVGLLVASLGVAGVTGAAVDHMLPASMLVDVLSAGAAVLAFLCSAYAANVAGVRQLAWKKT